MSGSRQKFLRKRFIALKGRPLLRTRWESDGFYASEWRKLKKAYKISRQRGAFS